MSLRDQRYLAPVLAALLLPAVPAAAQHSVLLPVPAHSQEALTWCGPAVAETLTEAYPGGACDLTQADLWLAIQAHKVEAAWDSDPEGLERAMETLCPPPGGGWSVFSNTDPAALMHVVGSWMTRRHYPVALLLDTLSDPAYPAHGEHWVTVRGFESDADPTTATAVTLQYVTVVDPAVPLGDPPVEEVVAGSAWFGRMQTVTKAGSAYAGKHVAVVEPPERRGVVRYRPEARSGPIIRPQRALDVALRWVQEAAPVLRRSESLEPLLGARPQEPHLVLAETGAYYLVPFSRGERQAAWAVLVNAHSGTFQSAGHFAPLRYLGREEATERARKALGEPRRPEREKAELVFAPAAGSLNRYRPVWRVQVGERELTVSQDGAVRAAERRPRLEPGPRPRPSGRRWPRRPG